MSNIVSMDSAAHRLAVTRREPSHAAARGNASQDDIPMRQAHERRGERTREETDRKILQATFDIITSQGIGAVSIEEVSRRSGVAKTTIYRRYRNTDDMLRSVRALDTGNSPELSNLAPTRENLTHLLETLVQRFSSQIGIKAVGVLLSSNNPYFQRITQQAIAPERERFSAFFERGMHGGAFRSGLDLALLFDTIIGSLVACVASTQSPAEGSWSDRMSALLWAAIVNPD